MHNILTNQLIEKFGNIPTPPIRYKLTVVTFIGTERIQFDYLSDLESDECTKALDAWATINKLEQRSLSEAKPEIVDKVDIQAAHLFSKNVRVLFDQHSLTIAIILEQ